MALPFTKAQYAKLTPQQKSLVKASLSGSKAIGRRTYTKNRTYVKKPGVYTNNSTRNKNYSYKSNWGDQAYSALQGMTSLAPAIIPAMLKVSGFGDYVMPQFSPQANNLMKMITDNGPPSLQSTISRSHVIRHREYLGDVFTGATAGFSITHYPINPGVSETFPWLSTLAQNFEQYKINGMIFEFKSTSADALNSTNTALGSVILCTEYNSDSDPFSNKQQMENHEFCSSAKQSCSVLHPVECKRSQTSISELYVRIGDVPVGQDLRLYDLGRFSIATVGQQGASVNIGELWCTYEVEFMKPQLPDVSNIVATDHIFSQTSVSTSNYFGTTQTTLQSSLGCDYSSNTITFPENLTSGAYLVNINWYNPILSPLAGFTAPTITLGGCAGFETYTNSTDSVLEVNSNGVSSNAVSIVCQLQIEQAGATLALSSGNLPAGTCMVDVVITRISNVL